MCFGTDIVSRERAKNDQMQCIELISTYFNIVIYLIIMIKSSKTDSYYWEGFPGD